MPVLLATDHMPLVLGTLHVAPPDRHLLIEHGSLRVVRGPRENLHRPAIDPLFRSAAAVYGNRVIGMVLTGMLHDGTAGLQAIKSRGGVTMVQDPAEAQFASMPLCALNKVQIDHCLPLAALAEELVALAGESGQGDEVDDQRLVAEAAMADGRHNHPDDLDRLGRRSVFSCPECDGVLWELDDDAVLRYRCHVGHAFTADSLWLGQTTLQERALWGAVRSLEEQASLLTRMARRSENDGHQMLAKRFSGRADAARDEARILRGMLLRENQETSSEPPGAP
jgi:two-component system chemotaxis response regulator CheB